MTTLGKLALADALGDVGYKEGPHNANKFAAMVGAPNHVAYCAIGVAKAWKNWVSFPKLFPLPWYVPSIRNTAKAKGWLVSTPEDGDPVIYDWNADHVQDHVGLAYPSKGKGYAVEYNTSSGKGGSQSDGGGVYIRQRSSAVIVGYVSMRKVCKSLGIAYETSPAPRPTLVRRKLKLRPIATRMRGEDVKEVQRAVGVKPDGSFGPDTDRAVKAYQRKHGLAVDGVVGADTWSKIKGKRVRIS